ncbi:hypothetical protein FXF65_40460 [Actinomadura syzygii]|uniref:Uncharacterized protein n=2 Tax=Actinomadura syzygii TaxID=1427538 RepID=A0A5D0TQZ3_9ACTN|nr:hypothetical protein FXF65_40460 [Actinomadura syzygii]
MPSTGAGKGSGGGGAKGLGKAGGGARGGMGGAPMGGRGGGKGEEDHERTTWLTEDEDVWGGNDDDASPPVIG